jgi:hypothetical protein
MNFLVREIRIGCSYIPNEVVALTDPYFKPTLPASFILNTGTTRFPNGVVTEKLGRRNLIETLLPTRVRLPERRDVVNEEF